MVHVDLSQPPFTLLDEKARSRVSRGLDLAYYDAGDTILDSGQPGEFVFIIHKGEVAELDMTAPESHRRIGHYTNGDIFGAISILNGKSRYRFQAEQESLCYLLPKALFTALCEDTPSFGAFFQQRLAEKTRRLLERRADGGVTMAGFMLARVSECMREPLIVSPETTLAEAATRLNTRHADSLLVSDGLRCGMVTKTDLLNAAIIEGMPSASPVLGIAHFALVSIRPEAYLFEALIRMTRHEVARVVVMVGEKATGVVELTDVLSFFSSRSYMVGLQIEQAGSLDELALASAKLPDLIRSLMAQGIKLRFAMELMAALNGRIVSKAFEFVVPEHYQAQSCLLVMGSEGRGEQILKTDQDNALILADGSDWATVAESMQRLNEALLSLGYPPCPGNVMVSNSEWVATESAWRGKITRWATSRDGASLMNLAIMLDAHGMAGNVALLDKLREHIFERCSGDELLLSQFARAALRFSTPLTMFGSVKRPEHGIDIKKGGIFPIVHGVRTLVLERRIATTSTFARLDALVTDGRLDAEFAEDLGAALSLFAELRLKQQLEQRDGAAQTGDANRIVVQRLSSLERDLLREALHTVKEFKQRLSHRYHLEY
ncbi:DUF294 nucleotidyltransferase-like domain-containing protein [Halomonas sp. WWR20]